MPDSLKTNALTVLVAPLDWGLGHTTRCIPIIRELMNKKCVVLVAGNGIQERIIREEFPQIDFLPLEGYNIRYGRSAFWTRLRLLLQIPKITRIIRQEHDWLQEQVRQHPIDVIISDNRYGLYHKKIPSVLLTHQLRVRTPLGRWGDWFARFVNYRWIRNFGACWVPDFEPDKGLAGLLSHPEKETPFAKTYVGPISRMSKNPAVLPKDSKLLILLSGPEPQRSLFENKLIDQLATSHFQATVVRGLPATASQIPSTNHLRFFNHLAAEDLSKEMQEAEWVISRCGYSTIMDLASLQKKSILVPTPGQAEQEYLAGYLQEKGMALCIPQRTFDLAAAIALAGSGNWRWPEGSYDGAPLRQAIDELLTRAKD